MTRIIQRCLLVLAFTGILLSSAQETTVSNASDSTASNDQTSTSAPESSSFAAQNNSSAPADKAENESSYSSDSTASSSMPEMSNASKTYSEIASYSASSNNETTSSASFESSRYNITDDGHSDIENSITTTSNNLSHSEGLLKSEEQDAESFVDSSYSNSEKLASILHIQNDSEKELHEASNEPSETDRLKTIKTAAVQKVTKETEMGETPEMIFENDINNSGQGDVPSGEEFTSKTSYIGSTQFSEKIFSTAPSKVQTKADLNDPKSSTQKRSLNATNMVTRSEQASSNSPTDVPFSSNPPQLLTEATKLMSSTNANTSFLKVDTEEPFSADAPQNNEPVEKIETTSTLPTKEEFVMHSDAQNVRDHTDDTENNAEMVLKTSPDSVDVADISAKSSIALSTSTGDSIHRSQTVVTIGETSHLSHFPTLPSSSHRPLIELEDDLLTSSSNSLKHEESLVTFDPNGMTNNYTQDPDSVTFTPEIVHVDGMPTDAFLSKLETNEFENNESKERLGKDKFEEREDVLIGDFTLQNSTELERVNASEREREYIPLNQDLLPHDEPDKEEQYDSLRNIKPTSDGQYMTASTSETRIAESDKNSKSPTHFLNDESEEMLNDAPQFFHYHSTPTPTKEIKKEEINVLKNSVKNITNDISSTTVFSPHNTHKAAHELDFSIVYHTEESEIRPVTVAIHSESSTLRPGSPTVETFSPSAVPKSESPDTVLPDISSPVILPNPAPSIANQSEETTTTVLQSVFVPENNSLLNAIDEGNSTILSPNSTIAGVAVKTSVSVSLPISISNESSISTEAKVKDQVNVSSTFDAAVPVLIPIKSDDEASQSTSAPSETPTASATESAGLKIRKPKLKIGGTDEPATPRTRKPFISPHQRSSSTAGPPVSIFKKSRTRIASITSSTTAKPFPKFSTIRVHYASRIPELVPGGELIISTEPITTTTVATTTETEEPFSDEPFTEQTEVPIVTNEDSVTLVKVAGYIVFDQGLRWNEQLDNRHSPQYKEKANFVHLQLERLFRTSPIAPHLWKIQIDGFSGIRKTKSVAVDFFLYLVKSKDDIPAEHLKTAFHEKLRNNTFSRFTVDTTKTSFEFVNEEPLKAPTPPPEDEEKEPVIPQWAIAVIVVGAASLIFIILFAAVAILGRHHVRRRYSNKLDEEDSDRPGDWESKMTAAYENLAADTIYDAEDLHSDTTYKKNYNSTYHGRPSSRPHRVDSWSSSDWSPPPRRARPQVHRIAF